MPLYASVLYTLVSAAFAMAGYLNGEQALWGISALLVVIAVLHAGFALGPVRMRARKRGPQLDRVVDTLERLAGAEERGAGLTPRTSERSTFPSADSAARLDAIAPEASESEAESPHESANQRLRA